MYLWMIVCSSAKLSPMETCPLCGSREKKILLYDETLDVVLCLGYPCIHLASLFLTLCICMVSSASNIACLLFGMFSCNRLELISMPS